MQRMLLILITIGSIYGEGLFFSEYGEGSSNNKYLEIYNGTGSDVDLTGLAFPNVANAPSNEGEYEYWNTFPTGATVAPGDVYVIAHPDSELALVPGKTKTRFEYIELSKLSRLASESP